ncbi:MAG TPA: disulfide oxidoreductase, partial [Azospirillum sp.]|nr:disulfide oxidoreductase [Azospirillum sp.]
QRFIDRRSAMLVRTLKDGRDLMAGVRDDGEVVVEGHPVGHLEGFRFVPDAPDRSEEARALLTAARRALRDEIASRVRTLEQEPDAAFALTPVGEVTWNGLPVARLGAGPSVLAPAVLPNPEALLDQGQSDRVRARLERWLRAHVAARLKPLLALRDAEELSGPARGLAFQLVEGLGVLPRAPVAKLIEGLEKTDRRDVAKRGVRLGVTHLYLPALAKPGAVELRALLWAVHKGLALPAPTPPAGRVSVAAEPGVPAGFWEAIGYPLAGPRAVRVDMLDRLETEMLKQAKEGTATPEPALAQIIGVGPDDLAAVLGGLGYTRTVAEDGAATWRRRRGRDPQQPRPRRHKPPAADHPFAKLRQLQGARG